MPQTAATLRIEHDVSGGLVPLEDDVPTDTDISELDIVTCEIERSFDEQHHAEVLVFRDDWDEIETTFDHQNDALFIELASGETIFGGRLDDIMRGGVTIELIIGDFETDARQGEPASGTLQYQNAPDSSIVADAINQCPSLRAGRVDTVSPATSFLFPHTSPAKMIRSVAESTGGEVRYNTDRTVDFIERRGRDKSEIIGPANQTVTNEFSLEQKVQDKPTHLMVLGSGEGDHQLETVIESMDYSEGNQRQIWQKISNKEVTSDDRLQSLGNQYMAEFDGSPEHIEVEADIEGVDVDLGDTFPVQYAEEQIDTRLRVIEYTQNIDEQGVHYDTVLSNRLLTRGDVESEVRQDVARYNEAFEGNAVPLADSGGRQPVNADHNYQFDIFYPSDVKRELKAKVLVEGLAYRAYSAGAAGGGATVGTTTSESNDEFESVVEDSRSLQYRENIGHTWESISMLTSPTPNTSVMFAQLSLGQAPDNEYLNRGYDLDDRSDGGRFYRIRLHNLTRNEYHPNTEGAGLYTYPNDMSTVILADATDVSEDDLELQIRYDGTADPHPVVMGIALWTGHGQHDHEIELNIPDHDHPPEPGIIEYDRYPSNCDVIVNNQEVGVSIGDGDGGFDEEVDISGMLREGFNTIEVSSDSLGHARASVSLDLYRQILGDS